MFLGILTGLVSAVSYAVLTLINSLKTLPAHLAGICLSLETVYGILFAMLLLREIPSAREIIGALIIVGSVVAEETGDDSLSSVSSERFTKC